MEAKTPPTAASILQSAKTMLGDLPPNSSVNFLMLLAAWVITAFPVSVEPVKDTISTWEWETSSLPAWAREELMIFKTPLGNPAWAMILPKAMTATQAVDDGFKTTVLPASKAGAIFHAAVIKG